MKYVVQWKYKSGLGGPWEKGQVLDLDPAEAEVINRDSSGVLEPQAEPKAREVKGPPKDRQVKAAKTTRTAGE